MLSACFVLRLVITVDFALRIYTLAVKTVPVSGVEPRLPRLTAPPPGQGVTAVLVRPFLPSLREDKNLVD